MTEAQTLPRMTKDEAESFLIREARLLDEGRLEEWNNLFTEDGVYWLPAGEGHDPEGPAIIYDNVRQRAIRIHQLLRYTHLAQDPPSRMVHFITNVEVEEPENGEVLLRCNMLLHEIRPGDFQELQIGLGEQRSFAGRCEYRLRREDVWRIAEKKVMLLNRDLPLSNLSFLM